MLPINSVRDWRDMVSPLLATEILEADMTDKTIEQHARDTMNALIAGGYLPGSAIFLSEGCVRIDKEMLRALEEQLRDYYSTRLNEPKL